MSSVTNKETKYFAILLSVFLVTQLATDATVYKLTSFDHITLSAASLIFPLTYLIADITAEVYGYRMAKKLIWIGTISNIGFSLLVSSLLKLHSPLSWHLAIAYHEVYNRLTFRSIVHALLVPFSYFVDIYLLSKWKILLKGKYFCLRSAVSTIIGDIIFSVLMVMITWWKSDINAPIVELAIATSAVKFIWALLGAYPAMLIVSLIKTSENVDVYDYYTNFNPFR